MNTSMEGFSVSNKAPKDGRSSNDKATELGLKLHRGELFPCRMNMVHHANHQRPFPSHDGGVDGPTCSSRPWTSDIYHVAGAAVVDGGAFGLRSLQPFDNSPTKTSATASAHTAFKAPGPEEMAASLGFPFTNAQWNELERQAIIYKYMMASVPVPPDLLIPITRNLSVSAASRSPLDGRLNLRFSSGGDPEPGRCRRTDGKKWRCSRAVAPDQKYCERHMHRGRPRSRKPVELAADFSNKKTRHGQALPALPPVTVAITNNCRNDASLSPRQFVGTLPQQFHQNTPLFLDESDEKAAAFESMTSFPSCKEPRNLAWMMRREPMPLTARSYQQWHNLMQSEISIGLSSERPFCTEEVSLLNSHYAEEAVNLNSYGNIVCGEDRQSDECSLLLKRDMGSLGKPETETPRGLIDAWSNGASDEQGSNSANEGSVSSKGKLHLSSLTLSRGAKDSVEGKMGQIQILEVKESSDDRVCGTKSHVSGWLPHGCAHPSSPGGPLAEVLRRRSGTSAATGGASNRPSPSAGNGDSVSIPATAVSSPSDVLQKTLL